MIELIRCVDANDLIDDFRINQWEIGCQLHNNVRLRLFHSGSDTADHVELTTSEITDAQLFGQVHDWIVSLIYGGCDNNSIDVTAAADPFYHQLQHRTLQTWQQNLAGQSGRRHSGFNRSH